MHPSGPNAKANGTKHSSETPHIRELAWKKQLLQNQKIKKLQILTTQIGQRHTMLNEILCTSDVS
jgi:hypothetical protein